MKYKLKLIQFRIIGFMWRVESNILLKLNKHSEKLFNKHGELFKYLLDEYNKEK